MQEQYEYRQFVTIGVTTDFLNEQGIQGWQLVSFCTSEDKISIKYIFKRKIVKENLSFIGGKQDVNPKDNDYATVGFQKNQLKAPEWHEYKNSDRTFDSLLDWAKQVTEILNNK